MDQLFTIDAYCAFNQLTGRVPFALSADGHKLALTLRRGRQPEEIHNDASFTRDGIPRGAIGSRILIIDTETGAVEEPFPTTQHTSWGAQWSPDGTRLAAYVQDEGPILGNGEPI